MNDTDRLLAYAERFWAKVDRTENCWIWTGRIDRQGFGVLNFQGKAWKAHRLALALSYPSFNPAHRVLATCGNRNCVRPDHMEIKPHSDPRCACGRPIRPQSKTCRPCFNAAKREGSGSRWMSNGYVLVSGHFGHPNASKKGIIHEHTLVMSQILGRPLRKGENVHHVNGVRDDNRPDNLELWTVSQPPGQRVQDKVAWAKEILSCYEPEALA